MAGNDHQYSSSTPIYVSVPVTKFTTFPQRCWGSVWQGTSSLTASARGHSSCLLPSAEMTRSPGRQLRNAAGVIRGSAPLPAYAAICQSVRGTLPPDCVMDSLYQTMTSVLASCRTQKHSWSTWSLGVETKSGQWWIIRTPTWRPYKAPNSFPWITTSSVLFSETYCV